MDLHDHALRAPLDQLTPLNKKRQTLQYDRDFVSRLDRIQDLGSDTVMPPTGGHRGCVNALAWSHTGQLLASGSDDFACCLWRLGASPEALDPLNDIEGHAPRLGISLESIIRTGHRRNIFGVKFAPKNEERLFTCAGDATVRVFDLGQAATGSLESANGSTWTEYSAASCQIRQFNCHSSRVKRIQTEESSPDVFLTCSEDGTVRQHDLRTAHSCGRQCPPPLADYSSYMELYSLTLPKYRPELFVCAGTGSVAFLHDRRFGRQIEKEWGVPPQSHKLSTCVRKFTLPECQQDNKHITACKISDDAKDLLVSWSDGPVACFDVFGDVDQVQGSDEKEKEKEHSQSKRKRDSHDSAAAAEEAKTRKLEAALAGLPEPLSDEPAAPDDDDDPADHANFLIQIDDNSELDVAIDPEGALQPAESDLYEMGAEVNSEDSHGLNEDNDSAAMEESDDEEEEESELDYDLLPSRLSRSRRDPHPSVPKMSTAAQQYYGHCNSRTVKDVNFLLGQDNVASGSDDGRLFIWDKRNADILNILKGDDDVVNVMQTHPYLPVIACSGIDSSVKIFAPTSSPPRRFSELDKREEITESNARQLEEGGAAAFVPASTLIRYLMTQNRGEGALSPADLRNMAEQEDCIVV